MPADLRDQTITDTFNWPSVVNNPPTRRMTYRSDDGVVHSAVELQWPKGAWEVRTRCERVGAPATWRETHATVDCMDCLSRGPWSALLLDAETFQ